MNKNSLDLTQLQSKITEAQLAEERLPQLRAEIKLANSELLRIDAEAGAKTEKLLKERTEVLDSSLRLSENKLAQLAAREEKLKSSVSELDRLIPQKALELSNLNSEILARNADITSLDTAIQEKKDTITTLTLEEREINGDLSRVSQRVANLRDEATALEPLVKDATDRLQNIERGISEQEQIYDEKRTQNEKQQKEWDAKLLGVQQEATILRRILQKEASGIADRKLAQDERDRVLRIREKKAGIQEGIIHQNASLLEL